MVCIYCGSPTKVTNSRHNKRSNGVWRRRECLTCATVFTSREEADISGTTSVTKKDSQPHPFSRDDLFLSIYESCRHRTTALTDATALTETVISKVLLNQNENGIVTLTDIRSCTHTTLRNFDAVAATYYQAYFMRSTA